MSKRKFPIWAALYYLVFTICGAESNSARIGYFPNITHAQALYAKATGEFEKQTGSKLTWISFNAGPTAIESLFANAIDMTFIGSGPTVNGFTKSRGEKFVIVSGAASGGSGLVVRADSGINTEKDFGDKTIATPQLGNSQDIAARVWFMEKGYKTRDRGGALNLVPVSNPDQLTLFQRKGLDAAWTVEPWVSRLQVEAGGKLFLDEKSLWPEGMFVTTHLIVSKQFLAGNPDFMRKLLSAHVDITQRINQDKKAAAKVLNDQLNKETGKSLKPEVISKAMENVVFTWDPISTSLHKSAEDAHRIGYMRTAPNLAGIYSLGLLNQVLAEKKLPPVTEK